MANPQRTSTLLMGAAGALIGLAVGLLVSATAAAEDYRLFPRFAAVAGFVTSAALWWTFIGRRAACRVRRGVLVGGAAGLLAQYVCWYLLFLSYNVCYQLTGGCTSSLGEPPADLLLAFGGAAVYALTSLLLFGWLTIPLGALAGGLIARRCSQGRAGGSA